MNVKGSDSIREIKKRIRDIRQIPQEEGFGLVYGTDILYDDDTMTINRYQIPVDGVVSIVTGQRIIDRDIHENMRRRAVQIF
jgi:hypothetical protein